MRLYDTMTREIQTLRAEDGKRYRMYCCGPTVYGPAHIGNFRTFLINDILRRMLEVAGLKPLYVRNITDVDDKTIAQCEEEGLSLEAFTGKWIDYFHEDCQTLNMVSPHEEPKATRHIEEQIELVEKLLAKKHAYQAPDGSVYFKVESYPPYGRLSRLDRRELRTQASTSGGTLNLADNYDRTSVADFALWKSHKPEDGDNFWNSPWGRGRPGWHLECSAMSMKYLGQPFDLHSGGEDLCFPHHENEIAQSEAATGKPFARHWFHAVHLLVDGKKMSKGDGNFFTLRDLLEEGWSPMVIRYALISAHYRQQLNFTHNGLHAAQSALQKVEKSVARLLATTGRGEQDFEKIPVDFSALTEGGFSESWKALEEDLNVPEAIGAMFSQLKETDRADLSREQAEITLREIHALLYALGLKLFTEKPKETEAPAEVRELAKQRWKAKTEKDWTQADALREQVKTLGWTIKDTRDGYELEAL